MEDKIIAGNMINGVFIDYKVETFLEKQEKWKIKAPLKMGSDCTQFTNIVFVFNEEIVFISSILSTKRSIFFSCAKPEET